MSVSSDLQAKVLAHQFSASRYSELIYLWLAEGQEYIFREADMRVGADNYEFATIAGTQGYALPSDYRSIIGVFNDDTNRKLEPMSVNDYEGQSTEYGAPRYYIVLDSEVLFFPHPDTTYNINFRYYTLSGAIDDDTEPILPADYHDLLVDYALWRAYLAEHDFEAAQIHQQIFMQGFEKLKGQLHAESSEPYSQVPGAWGQYT